MKKLFRICSVLVAALFFFSCSNFATEYGTIILRLPGNSNRAAVNINELSFNVEVTNQRTSEVTTQSAAAGENCSIDLPKGMYTVKVEAYKAAKKDQILFTGSKTDVEIIPGNETPVSLKLKSVYEDVDLNATIKIATVTKGDLVMEVEGSYEHYYTVRSLSGIKIDSYTWMINGVPVLEDAISYDDPANPYDFIVVESNRIKINGSLLYELLSSYKFNEDYEDYDNPYHGTLTCIVETKTGELQDISIEIKVKAWE